MIVKAPRPETMFQWLENMTIVELASQRRQLATRISLLPPRSHKRIELESMAAALCRRQLELELAQEREEARR